MLPLKLLILGVVIGSNNLASSLALGAMGQVTRSRRWRIIAVFGVFEFVVPLVGVALGQQASARIAGQSTWIGPALLIGLGVWIVYAGLRDKPKRDKRMAEQITTWQGLVLLALGLSLDNLLVGFSLGLEQIGPLLAATTIAIFSMGFAWIGLVTGKRLRKIWRQRAQIGSGVLLVLVGIASAMGVL